MMEIANAQIITEDWIYTEVWDDWDWDYYDKWMSRSYFVDTEGAVLKEATILSAYTVNIAASSNGSVTADKSVAFAGDSIQLTIEAAAGYTLDTLTATNDSGETVTVTSDHRFHMPDSNVYINATFKSSGSGCNGRDAERTQKRT